LAKLFLENAFIILFHEISAAAMFEANVIVWPFFNTESVEDRRKYIIKVFLEFAAFVLIGFVHWILMLTLLQ